jgi:hypothetical protein
MIKNLIWFNVVLGILILGVCGSMVLANHIFIAYGSNSTALAVAVFGIVNTIVICAVMLGKILNRIE